MSSARSSTRTESECIMCGRPTNEAQLQGSTRKAHQSGKSTSVQLSLLLQCLGSDPLLEIRCFAPKAIVSECLGQKPSPVHCTLYTFLNLSVRKTYLAQGCLSSPPFFSLSFPSLSFHSLSFPSLSLPRSLSFSLSLFSVALSLSPPSLSFSLSFTPGLHWPQ